MGSRYWHCGQCYFINDEGSAMCELCGRSATAPPTSDNAWTCNACTFVNDSCRSACEVCQLRRNTTTEAAPCNSAEPGKTAQPLRGLPISTARVPNSTLDATRLPTGPADPSTHDDAYILNVCSCLHDRRQLDATILSQLSALSSCPNLAAAVGVFQCPNSSCGQLMAHQDIRNLLGDNCTRHVYELFTPLMSAHLHGKEGMDVHAPNCSSCGKAMLETHELTPTNVLNLRDTRKLLKLKAAPTQGTPTECLQRLAALYSSCAWVCTTCGNSLQGEASNSRGQEIAALCKQATELHRSVSHLHNLVLGTALNEVAPDKHASSSHQAREGTNQQPPPINKVPPVKMLPPVGTSHAWAKGTGYGGDGGDDTDDDMDDHLDEHDDDGDDDDDDGDDDEYELNDMDMGIWAGRDEDQLRAAPMLLEAKRRQQLADAAMRDTLQALHRDLAPLVRSGAVPLAACAACLSGHLAHALRVLLQNDSLADISARQQLYGEVFLLLRLVTSSLDLIPLLDQPAVAPAPKAGADGPSPPAASSMQPNLLAMLQRLSVQCSVFKRSAEELGAGDDDDVAALATVLEISSVHEEVRDALAIWRASIAPPPEPADADLPARPAAQPDPPATLVAATRARRGAAARRASTPAAAVGKTLPAADAAAAREAQLARDAQYVQALGSLQFSEQPLWETHYFRQQMGGARPHKKKKSAAAGGGGGGGSGDMGGPAGGELMRRRLRRITQEMSSLSTSLPLTWDSSICVAMDAERMDVLRALILPAADTPYANGAFVFDILLPDDYPDRPPMVQFLTTGAGTVGFNPNLYACGKVCLSLLGTWAGPSWQPGQSTLLQVLVSIQSMIFVAEPYFNEPGLEEDMHTGTGRKASREYNDDIRAHTLEAAVLAALRKPDPAFREAILTHFRLKRDELIAQCQRWARESGKAKRMQQASAAIEAELRKL